MQHSFISRLLAGASATALLATGAAMGGTAHAASAQSMFSYAQGWRVDQHVRELADVNGDLRMDIVGFGDPGVFVAYGQPNGTFGAPVLKVRDFGRHQGWRVDMHPREVVDVDGDGRSDLVGFGNAGTYISYARTDGSFTAPVLKVRDFGWDQGWRVDKHPREVGPVVRTSRSADIVGFGHSGVLMARGQDDRTFTAATKVSDSYGYNRGWRVEKHPRMLTDLEGGTQEGILAFGDAGTYVSHWSTRSVEPYFDPPALVVTDFGFRQGWRVGQHPRQPGDVNGDRSADVVGYGHRGVYVSYARTDRTFGPVSLELGDFGTAQGWRADRHLRTLADINGDGIQDLVGFGDAGVHVAYGDDNFFFGPELKTAGYGYDQGWTEDRYPRLLGDINGDGRDDVVGFGHSATYVTLS